MDISKMDEAFKNAKGYYEIIAEKENEGSSDKRILRFNINAFRNREIMFKIIFRSIIN